MSKQTPQINNADISFKDGLPYSKQFDDIYFSQSNGLEESRYNFIQHNHLNKRWSALNEKPSTSFIIAETGFGTGLNFLASCQLWNKLVTNSSHLYFFSVEKYPLSKAQLKQSLDLWPELEFESQALLDNYPCTTPGLHSLAIQKNITLQLFIGDINDALTQWLPLQSICDSYKTSSNVEEAKQLERFNSLTVDAWFLDGFAPAKNPDMWSEHLFQHMGVLSKPGTTFATFTAAGDVRRGLKAVGFNAIKVKGFGKKREMLCGVLESTDVAQANIKSTHSNWSNYTYPHFHHKTATVIGAGLAGCLSAYELAESGWKVTLIEKKSNICDATSGNRQSVLYTRLSWPFDKLTEFNLAAFQFSSRYFQSAFKSFQLKPECGEFCGVLQLAHNEKEKQRLLAVHQALHTSHPDFCHYVTQEQMKSVSGFNIGYEGLHFKQAGWFNPQKVCQSLVQHENISIIYDHAVDKLDYQNQQWHLSLTAQSKNTPSQKTLTSDVVVVCNSLAAQQFFPDYQFPIKNIRGQVSHVQCSEESEQLKTVICHQGYIAPSYQGRHDIGATFTLHESTENVLNKDHEYNLNMLEEFLPDISHSLGSNKEKDIKGRTGFRCTTTDYLPLVGAVHHYPELMENFKELRHHANKILHKPNTHKQGLFLNIAHGSRGLSSAPLAAAHISSLVNRTPSPLHQDMQIDVHPSRFAIRDLKKRKV